MAATPTASMAFTSKTTIPLRASLQGLPRELRDKIYEHLATTEERIVLGRRFTRPWLHADYYWDSIEQAFESSLALHPLSMTCRQMRKEFQPFHVSALEAPWVFLVNNFDVPQLETFGGYFQSDNYWQAGEHAEWTSEIPDCILRLQMDRDAVRSASELCQYVRAHKYSFPIANDSDLEYLANGEGMFTMQYTPRVYNSIFGRHNRAMSLGKAKHVKYLFRKLWQESIAYNKRSGFRERTFHQLVTYWLVPFCKTVNNMEQT